MEENGRQNVIVREGGSGIMPALPMEDVIARHNQIVQFVQKAMKEGVDYGTVGDNDKKCLFKSGAEKLCTLFGMRADFGREPGVCIEDWDKDLFFYSFRCVLHTQGGEFVGAGIGSCNSREKKYRYRWVGDKYITPEDKQRVLGSRRNRGGWTEYALPNPDIADVVNTIQKMGQKRALVAAVLVAVGASQMFTQDLEEIDAEGGDEEPESGKTAASDLRGAPGGGPKNSPAPDRSSIDDWFREVKAVGTQHGFADDDLHRLIEVSARKNQVNPTDAPGEWHEQFLAMLKGGAYDAVAAKQAEKREKAAASELAAGSGATSKRQPIVVVTDIDELFGGKA